MSDEQINEATQRDKDTTNKQHQQKRHTGY